MRPRRHTLSNLRLTLLAVEALAGKARNHESPFLSVLGLS